MSQPTSGLRFDIYERVHLPDNMPGIRELDSMELTPDIGVVSQGEQAVLKGHLILSGTYTGDDEAGGERQLTHRIPVEITLPMDRIEDVNDIRVEIENFDVDVLSQRSLNVTGVLSLCGIDMVNAAGTEWREEEEVVFTHRVEEEASPSADMAQPSGWAGLSTAPPPAAQSARREEKPAAQPENEANEANAVNEAMEAPEAKEEHAANEANESVAGVSAAEEQPVPNAAEEALEDVNPPPSAQEIKIAFSGKPEEAAEQAPLGVNAIMSIANAGAPQTNAEHPAEAVAPAAAENEEAPEGKDKVEWKRLFLQTAAGEHSFTRVRMCIAQKEDTIETIAERYQKNVRELMLYNRLNEEYLKEGQIVYIP